MQLDVPCLVDFTGGLPFSKGKQKRNGSGGEQRSRGDTGGEEGGKTVIEV